MSLPEYSAYKENGLSWLGRAPAHWRTARFKEVLRERDERSLNGTETLLSVSAYTGVRPRAEIVDAGDHVSRAESLEGYKVCYPNDLVMNIMLAWNRGLGVSEHHGIVSPAYCVFKLDNNKVLPSFIHYLVRSDEFIGYFKTFSYGVIDSRLRLYPDVFGGLKLFLPTEDEQKAIASFLDHETAKIDALVAEQKRLIGLLKEKRQAVISHAVTKGLDPNVPMKDSGVEWLGEIPAGWSIQKLGRLASRIVDGTHFTPTYVEDGVPFLRVTDITADKLDLDEVKRIPLEEYREVNKRCNPVKGDLLLSKNGTIGVPRVIDWDWDFSIFVSLCLIKLKQDFNAYFASYVFLSSFIEIQIKDGIKQSTVTNLHLEKIRAFIFPVPPMVEQAAIIHYLDQAVASLDSLIDEAEYSCSLLKERRSAVISAAVTGKIDVRNLAPAVQEAA